MNEIVQKENIEDMIYEIRGKQVMLDSDYMSVLMVQSQLI